MSIMISLSSITNVINADKQTTLLREAKKGWRDNKQYYAPTLTAGVLSVIQSHPENLKGLLIDLLNQPNVLLASSNSLMIANSEKTWNESVKTYTFPSGLPYTNVMYVNTAL
ncbi:hypothetical protein [Lactococcus allomyrinae]|uniref:Uncharacterized protein n=1 Tax=Lactococcus allomyrinae TaxID=2419773 RepID=A0A387BJ07_9LACT|nr:hypothetical protein [Lactococcus allomyrinae]AYG01017.1 hypothetical protein D7I46_07920 [Lactococcus allomyrinae]